MPGSSSYTPKSVTPSVSKKRFTLDQANRALPLVKRITADIVRAHAEVADLQAKLETVKDAREHAAAQTQAEALLVRLQNFAAELKAVGCDLKDPQTGLLDFIGQHNGRDVCLCWRLGEEQIAHWHETSAGFAGRKPVALLDERA